MDCLGSGTAMETSPRGVSSALAPVQGAAPALRRSGSTVLATAEAVPAHLQQAAASRGMNRYRIHVGDLIVELRYFPKHSSTDNRLGGRRAMLLIPLTQALDIVTETVRLTCPAGTPFLFARDEAATMIWPGASWGIAIHFRRERLNAAASARLGDGRKLVSVAVLLESCAQDDELDQAARRFIALMTGFSPQQEPAVLAIESHFYQLLVERLLEQNDVDAFLSPFRSVSEAMRIVRDNHSRAYDTEGLAALVGVTAQTLRKGFRACLGMSVRDYIQMVRLNWARETLSSARDGRAIAEIARSAGFPETPPFSRAYMKRFGEPPSQTRARAVHNAME